MLFSERKKLEEDYYEWAKAYPFIKDCPFSVITYLDERGLLHKTNRRKRSADTNARWQGEETFEDRDGWGG